MRIVAGRYGGRIVQGPKTQATRPMTDKVRAAVFDRLGSIDDLAVLDLYAGSGAIGFEALSRGAARVVAVEAGSLASQAIRKNVEALGLSIEYQQHQSRVESWLAQSGGKERFDLIFAMPPYAILDVDILNRLAHLLTEDGLLIVEHPSREAAPQVESLRLIDTRSYGDPAISIYQK